MNSILKSNYLNKFRSAAARYLFKSQSAAAASSAHPPSGGNHLISTSSKLKPPSTWGFVGVQDYTVFVIERFGKHAKTLHHGWNILIPFVDRIAYVQSLRQQYIKGLGQVAITTDGVPLRVDTYFAFKIFDPVLASYNVENVRCSLTELARKTMVTEIEKRTCDKVFEERFTTLRDNIRIAINEVTKDWGLECELYIISGYCQGKNPFLVLYNETPPLLVLNNGHVQFGYSTITLCPIWAKYIFRLPHQKQWLKLLPKGEKRNIASPSPTGAEPGFSVGRASELLACESA